MLWLPVGLAAAVAGVLLTAGIPFNYHGAVQSGRNAIPYARQFDRLFPKSDHFISYFTGTSGQPTWKSETVLYGRYELTMQLSVQFNVFRNRVVSSGEPQFTLVEIESITGNPGSGGQITYGQPQIHFGPAEWQKLVQSGGDLRVLGFSPTKYEPVQRADQLLTEED